MSGPNQMTIMTIMTIRRSSQRADHDLWTVADAKARLSEVLDRARTTGPQVVTRRGRKAAVIVAIEEWQRKSARTGSLAEFLARSPLRGSSIKIARRRGRPRKVDI